MEIHVHYKFIIIWKKKKKTEIVERFISHFSKMNMYKNE